MQRKQKYNKVRISAVVVGVAGILASAGALAAGAKNCRAQHIEFVDEGRSLSFEAELLGLANNRDVRVTMTATAEVELACTSPSGKEPPGAQPDDIMVELSDSKTYLRDRIENGRLDISLQTDELGYRIAGAPDCPICAYEEWTETVESVRFIEMTLVVRQTGRDTLTILCSFDSPSRNGSIPANDISCEVL
jgi:hypothetical protein